MAGLVENDDEELSRQLAHLQMEINRKTDQSLESTRRMVKDVDEAEDAGIKTLELLDHNREQLNNIDKGMDAIGENMEIVEYDLQEMEKCCGCCVCPWHQRRRATKLSSRKQSNGKTVTVDQQPRAKRQRKVNETKQQYIQRITNDEREDEMNENIGRVDDAVHSLKGIAIDMGDELVKQNEMLDGINEKAATNRDRVDAANKRAEKLLEN